MNKYEALFIVKPELSEEERKNLFRHIDEVVTKHHGSITQSGLWSEKRKLTFPIAKHSEGVYYLMNFSLPSLAVKDIRNAYRLNENILRVLVTVLK
jgi:small subunit ribosomal protein S6